MDTHTHSKKTTGKVHLSVSGGLKNIKRESFCTILVSCVADQVSCEYENLGWGKLASSNGTCMPEVHLFALFKPTLEGVIDLYTFCVLLF